jgi:hypothetical protein
MKYHVTHCDGCGVLMLCGEPACALPDHFCYGCIHSANARESSDELRESPVNRDSHVPPLLL